MINERSEKNQNMIANSNYKNFITLSIILNLALFGVSGLLYNQYSTLQKEVKQFAVELEGVLEENIVYEEELNMTRTQLEYYRSLATELSSTSSCSIGNSSIIGSTRIPIVSVQTRRVGFTSSYEGKIMWADIELLQGEGRVLIDTMVINGADIQSSLRTAAFVVEDLTGVSFSGTDIILSIEGGSDVELVDGPSAGAAITMGIYSAVTGAELRSDVFITGTINSEGKVGPIGGVQYKAIAVAENNGSLFLVPLGQSSLTTYREVTRNMGGMSFTFYEPVDVDLEDYLDELGYNVEVIEVSDIDDVITYYHSP